MKEGKKMANKKEIKIVWCYNSSNVIQGCFYFVNKDRTQTYMLTIAGNPDEKVLKAKALIKEVAPDYINNFLSEHPDFEQVEDKVYNEVYSQVHGIEK